MTHPIDINTDHAEKFGRPAAWVRRGLEKRKPTDIRRLELRRVRRVRRVEVTRLAANDCAERGEEAEPFDFGDGYDDAWDYYCWGTPEDAEAERSRFRVTITANSWASAVASVSAAGETFETWEAARKFHRGGE